VKPFNMLDKGKAPTFLEATFANMVLRCLNAIIRFKVVPAAAGKVVPGDDAFVLDLTPMQAAAQAAQIESLQKQLATAQGQINAINAALKTATITCEGGNVVLVLKKLP
jgi:hypothetical protein